MAAGGTGDEAAALVTGRIVIPPATPPFAGATAYVRLEDVSFADAPALTIAEGVIPDVGHRPTGTEGGGSGETVVPFALHLGPGAAVDPGHDYAVRAWVDLDGDGRLGPGDPRSDQSHRVLTRGFGRTVDITLAAR